MIRLLLLLLTAVALSSCATVELWERDRFAKPHMQFKQKDKGQFFLDHTVITVEQAEGGNGKAGGGCGCR